MGNSCFPSVRGVSWTFPGAVGCPQPPVSQRRGAVQVLMSTLAACEADEALSGVGDSRGCPGEGFAFPLLFGFGVWRQRPGPSVQLHAAVHILTGRKNLHICPLFGTVYHKHGGKYCYFVTWRIWQTCSGLFAFTEGVFKRQREKINSKTKSWLWADVSKS